MLLPDACWGRGHTWSRAGTARRPTLRCALCLTGAASARLRPSPSQADGQRCCGVYAFPSGSCLGTWTAQAFATRRPQCTLCVEVAQHAVGNDEELLPAGGCRDYHGSRRQFNGRDAQCHDGHLRRPSLAASASEQPSALLYPKCIGCPFTSTSRPKARDRQPGVPRPQEAPQGTACTRLLIGQMCEAALLC